MGRVLGTLGLGVFLALKSQWGGGVGYSICTRKGWDLCL